MPTKEPVRNEHIESYLAGKFDEIPEGLLPLVKERVERMPKPAPRLTIKPGKKAEATDGDGEA